MKFVLATRGSKLALWQAEATRALLLAAHPDWQVELLTVTSTGDRERELPFFAIGTTGVFTAEVDHAVASGRAHAAVHSCKDLPTALPDGIVFAGTLARAPAEDVLIAREGERLSELQLGAKVATGSVRRVAMVRSERPDLELVSIRGNVDTRLAKLAAGEADAIVLARAGLERLGLAGRATEILHVERFVPAVGQGIVALTAKSDDEVARSALDAITDRDAMAEALAERALLRELHGGCNAPIGAHARARENGLAIFARVLSLDGAEMIEGRLSGRADEAQEVGLRLAETLRAQGAVRLVEAARSR